MTAKAERTFVRRKEGRVSLAYGGGLKIEIPALGRWNQVLGGKTVCVDGYEVTTVQDLQLTIMNLA